VLLSTWEKKVNKEQIKRWKEREERRGGKERTCPARRGALILGRKAWNAEERK
jgi:hypothetical protein